jgi:hypothetical protein
VHGSGDTTGAWREVDPFDLPDWLGTAHVVWTSLSSLRAGARVAGELSTAGEDPVGCDLLAVDEAYPMPIAEDGLRRAAHQAWRRDEVYVIACSDRLALAVPGSAFDADRALDAVGRLAKAVGAAPAAYAVCLRVGRDGR